MEGGMVQLAGVRAHLYGTRAARSPHQEATGPPASSHRIASAALAEPFGRLPAERQGPLVLRAERDARREAAFGFDVLRQFQVTHAAGVPGREAAGRLGGQFPE